MLWFAGELLKVSYSQLGSSMLDSSALRNWIKVVFPAPMTGQVLYFEVICAAHVFPSAGVKFSSVGYG